MKSIKQKRTYYENYVEKIVELVVRYLLVVYRTRYNI